MSKESWCVPVYRQAVQQPRPGKQSMISRGNGAGHDNGVDKAARDGTSGLNEDDRERARTSRSPGQVGIIVGHVQANDEDG